MDMVKHGQYRTAKAVWDSSSWTFVVLDPPVLIDAHWVRGWHMMDSEDRFQRSQGRKGLTYTGD